MAKKVRAQPQICASVSARSVREMERKASASLRLGADLVEFRVDRLDEPDPLEVRSSLRGFAPRAIVTVRSGLEGGSFKGGEAERLELLSQLVSVGPAYVDVELRTAKENPRWVGSLPKKTKKIVSWHDFHGTPGTGALERTCRDAIRRGDFAKVVTTATRLEDNARVLRLSEEHRGRVVAFCMGEMGVASRLLSLLVGAPLAYASLPDESVAPGQLSISTMLEFRGLVPEEGR